MHDLVIENALLIDGTGTPARPGSLAVADGRIAAIGNDVGGGRSRVDAQGLALAPGIIDLHTHFDAQLMLGPVRDAVGGAGRHERGDRQLRLHHRAVPAARTATSRCAT